jgi:hypothetical protein
MIRQHGIYREVSSGFMQACCPDLRFALQSGQQRHHAQTVCQKVEMFDDRG